MNQPTMTERRREGTGIDHRGLTGVRVRAGLAALLLAGGAGIWPGPALATEGPPPAAPPPPEVYPPDPNEPEPSPQAPTGAPAGATAPAAAEPATIERGKGLFKDNCQKCHGIDMVSPGPPFFDLRTFPHDQKDRFVQSVTHGKRAMPAWGTILKPDEIESLWAYVSSYRP